MDPGLIDLPWIRCAPNVNVRLRVLVLHAWMVHVPDLLHHQKHRGKRLGSAAAMAAAYVTEGHVG
eukprot:6705-Pelagomonas_calceolata.AAC.3